MPPPSLCFCIHTSLFCFPLRYLATSALPFAAHRRSKPAPQLPPEIEFKDTGYVARIVVFALMCVGCFMGILLWIGQVTFALVAQRGLLPAISPG